MVTLSKYSSIGSKVRAILCNVVEHDWLLFQVTRAMLLWVNNHYGDFEGDPVMEDYLGTFEKGLELQVSSEIVPCPGL